MRLLITGALGFAGRYLAEAAKARGYEVLGHGLPERPEGPAAAFLDGYLRADITQFAQVEALIEEARPDAVAHLAAQASGARSFQDPVESFSANTMGTLHLLDAARRRDFKGPILSITSSEAYGRITLGRPVDESSPLRPVSPYAASKAAADNISQLYSQLYGLSVMRARAFSHTGPGQQPIFVAPAWAQQVARAEARAETGEKGPFAVRVGNLDPVRDLADVRDVVQAYLALLERGRGGEAYNVCTEKGIKMRDLLGKLIALSTVEVTVESDPQRARPADIPYLVGSAQKIRRELGWEAKRDLDDTLRDLLDYWRDNVGAVRATGGRA
jgi:GDP-4-dehydro-6-deoxy-D-mannose reductase